MAREIAPATLTHLLDTDGNRTTYAAQLKRAPADIDAYPITHDILVSAAIVRCRSC